MLRHKDLLLLLPWIACPLFLVPMTYGQTSGSTGSLISPKYPFVSRYVEVHGSKIHYIEEGSGDPILFLHGNPASSYLWRNVIPHVSPYGRVIAPDLIGYGKSDKPFIEYRVFDQIKYIEGFTSRADRWGGSGGRVSERLSHGAGGPADRPSQPSRAG